METSTAEQVLEFIRSHAGSMANIETPLDGLGMDSLEFLNFQLECQEKFGKKITDQKQSELHTVGDIVNFFS